MTKKDIGIGDIALIGGLGIGGVLLYKAVTKKTETPTPSQDWSGANDLIKQLGEGNQKTLDAILALVGKSNNSDGNAGSSGGGSSGGGGLSPSPGDGSGETIDDVKRLLSTTKTALDKLGYSGRFAQIKTITNEQVDKDREKFAETPGVGVLDKSLNSDIKLETNKTLTGDPYRNVGLNATNLINPTAWSKTFNQAKNNLTGLINWATGKKNVDDPLAIS